MRSIILTVLLLSFVSLSAQTSKKMLLNNPQITNNEGLVQVKFSGYVGKSFTGRNYEVVLLPVLINGTDSTVLTPIVAQSRHNQILRERKIYSGDLSSSFPDAVFLRKGKKFTYSTVFPYEKWMNGSHLKIVAFQDGCCKSDFLGSETILNPIILETEMPEAFVPEPPVVKTAIKEEQSFMIEFKVSSSTLLKDYANNKFEIERLNNLLNEQVAQNSSMQLDRIEIVGFASPEGPIEFNKQLAERRAITLKNYIQQNYPAIHSDKISIKNGDIDWSGLIKLVELSDLKNKEQVLNIIRSSQNGPELTQKLRAIDKGETYLYLLTTIYPKLRFVYAINIYYK